MIESREPLGNEEAPPPPPLPAQETAPEPELRSSPIFKPAAERVIAVRRKKRLLVWFLLLVLVAVSGGGVYWKYFRPGADWRQPEPGRHISEANGFSIRFPEGWAGVREVGQYEEAVCPPGGDEYFDRLSVVVVVQPSGREPDLEVSSTLAMTRMRNALEEIELKGAGGATVAGAPAKCQVFTCKLDGEPLKVKHYCVVKSSRAFSIFFRAAAESFESHLPAFEKAVESFKAK